MMVFSHYGILLFDSMNTLLDWDQTLLRKWRSLWMVGDQEDTDVPGYIYFRECILSRGIHMSGPKVSHLMVEGVKQCTQM